MRAVFTALPSRPNPAVSAGLGLFASVALACSGTPPPGSPPGLATDAFVWGYPLVVTERTLQTLGGLIGVNALLNQSTLSSTTARFIVSPNQDTVYSIAVLDLRSEPICHRSMPRTASGRSRSTARTTSSSTTRSSASRSATAPKAWSSTPMARSTSTSSTTHRRATRPTGCPRPRGRSR